MRSAASKLYLALGGGEGGQHLSNNVQTLCLLQKNICEHFCGSIAWSRGIVGYSVAIIFGVFLFSKLDFLFWYDFFLFWYDFFFFCEKVIFIIITVLASYNVSILNSYKQVIR